ncbi:hypothetical protein BU15DRAFT_72540 [Melanogaster broomeanus]|nr:hypothetical protein BU15DRAFT_72540 [Melanogaster broomeanus]
MPTLLISMKQLPAAWPESTASSPDGMDEQATVHSRILSPQPRSLRLRAPDPAWRLPFTDHTKYRGPPRITLEHTRSKHPPLFAGPPPILALGHQLRLTNVYSVFVGTFYPPFNGYGPKQPSGGLGDAGNLCPWEPFAPSWLSDLGANTETDRLFRQNPLATSLIDGESCLGTTPALSLSAVSPSSRSSWSYPKSATRSPVSSPSVPFPHSSPPPLALEPTGTDTSPSTPVDSLQAWRRGVMPGVPQLEGPYSEFPEDSSSPASPGARSEELMPEAVVRPASLPGSQDRTPAPLISKSQHFVEGAKSFGGRIRRDVNFGVFSGQDSVNGSADLINAPPLSYDIRPFTPIPPHSPEPQDHLRLRTVSEGCSTLPGRTAEDGTIRVSDPVAETKEAAGMHFVVCP